MLAAVPDLSWLICLFILAQFFVPLYQKQVLERRRNGAFHAFEPQRRPGVEFIPIPYPPTTPAVPPRSERPGI